MEIILNNSDGLVDGEYSRYHFSICEDGYEIGEVEVTVCDGECYETDGYGAMDCGEDDHDEDLFNNVKKKRLSWNTKQCFTTLK